MTQTHVEQEGWKLLYFLLFTGQMVTHGGALEGKAARALRKV